MEIGGLPPAALILGGSWIVVASLNVLTNSANWVQWIVGACVGIGGAAMIYFGARFHNRWLKGQKL